MAKKKSIVDISNASAEVLKIIEKNYPNGYEQATNLVRYNNSKGDLIVALPIETEDTEYLVKFKFVTRQQIEEELALDDLNTVEMEKEKGDSSDDEEDDDDGYGDKPEEESEED
jgi:phosphopantothenoylcysteine synthetase/decarboxylase